MEASAACRSPGLVRRPPLPAGPERAPSLQLCLSYLWGLFSCTPETSLSVETQTKLKGMEGNCGITGHRRTGDHLGSLHRGLVSRLRAKSTEHKKPKSMGSTGEKGKLIQMIQLDVGRRSGQGAGGLEEGPWKYSMGF